MHQLFAGLTGLFMGFSSFFHGAILPINANPNAQINHANISITPNPYGERGFGKNKVGVKGGRPFFGVVTAVNGSQLTIHTQKPFNLKPSDITPSATPEASKTLIIVLNASTNYKNGQAADIKTDTKIAGIGKNNNDGTITATAIIIDPVIPTDFPKRSISGSPSDFAPGRIKHKEGK